MPALFSFEVTPQTDLILTILFFVVGLGMAVSTHYAYAGTLRPYVTVAAVYTFMYTVAVTWSVNLLLTLRQAADTHISPTYHVQFYLLWLCVAAGLALGLIVGSKAYVRFLVRTGRV